MAHYALINEHNIVTQVIVGRDENDLPDGITSWEDYYGNFHGQTCVRTSYNTHGNQHTDGGTPFRGNYAGIGFTYDPELDVFVSPQPFPSWVLDKATFLWTAPIPYPDDGKLYVWDENTLQWIVPIPEPEQP